MNKEQKLQSLKLYLESFDRLPEEALRHGISIYEFKTVVELLVEIVDELMKVDPKIE